jgi:hypothetical protein
MPAAGCFLGRQDVHLAGLKHKDAKGTEDFTKREKILKHEGAMSTKIHEGFPIITFFVSFVSALAASCLRFNFFCVPFVCRASGIVFVFPGFVHIPERAKQPGNSLECQRILRLFQYLSAIKIHYR